MHGVRLPVDDHTRAVLSIDPDLDPVLELVGCEPLRGQRDAADPDDPVVERLALVRTLRSTPADPGSDRAADRRSIDRAPFGGGGAPGPPRLRDRRTVPRPQSRQPAATRAGRRVGPTTGGRRGPVPIRVRSNRSTLPDPSRIRAGPGGAAAARGAALGVPRGFRSPGGGRCRRALSDRALSDRALSGSSGTVGGHCAAPLDLVADLAAIADLVQVIAITDDASVASTATRFGPDLTTVVCW